jgi:cytochrome c nitrite reductase small subunit
MTYVRRLAMRGVAAPLLLACFTGAMVGMGLFTFGYARGSSYLTDRPEACANCHVMSEQYTGWMRASHRKVAVCNDCHTPPGIAAKYGTKALNGFYHSLAFTTGRYPDDIRITSRNMRVTESACLKCHGDLTAAIRMGRGAGSVPDCIRCHRNVGHL